MVRQGALAFVIVSLAACTQNVDDPAVFTAGPNSSGNSMGSSTTDGDGMEATTGANEGSASATTTGGVADSTSTTSADTTPPADTGNPACGNGMIDMGEQCDGADLQGFNCASLGLNGGTLACDPMMCTFDTSMCSSTTGTSG